MLPRLVGQVYACQISAVKEYSTFVTNLQNLLFLYKAQYCINNHELQFELIITLQFL